MRKLIAQLIYPEIFREYDTQMKYKDEYKDTIIELNDECNKFKNENTKLNQQIEDLNSEIIDIKLKEMTELEQFCAKTYTEVSKFAYKDKREYSKIKYAVYPNELIQPNKYLVDLARKEVGLRSNYNVYTNVMKVGKYVDNKLKWTSDKVTKGVPDYYSSSVESLLVKHKDCEDHSFLASSLLPEVLGVAFGFCGDGGHAWNVFLYNGELWCLETNSVYDNNKNTKLFKYADQTHYKIHWIFTKDKTFRVADKPVNFGTVVRL